MLKHLRNKSTQKKIYILIAIGVLPAFLIWGVQVGDENKQSPFTLGTIDGKKITVKDYKDSYSALYHQVQMVYGDKANQLLPYFNIRGQAMDRLLLLHYARKNGLKTSDAEVVRWIGSQPVFMEKGALSMDLYQRLIDRYLRTTTRVFEEEIRGTLTLEKIRAKLKSQVVVSDDALRKAYDAEKGPKTVSYILFAADPALIASQTVTPDEIEKVTPLLASKLTDENTGKPLEKAASDEKIESIIAEQKAKSELFKKAEELRVKIAADGIDKVGQTEGLQPVTVENFVKGVTLPSLGANPEVEQVIAGLKEGETSNPLMLKEGVVVLQVQKVTPADNVNFEKDKKEFKEIYIESEADKSMDKILAELREKANIDVEVLRKLFGEDEEN